MRTERSTVMSLGQTRSMGTNQGTGTHAQDRQGSDGSLIKFGVFFQTLLLAAEAPVCVPLLPSPFHVDCYYPSSPCLSALTRADTTLPMCSKLSSNILNRLLSQHCVEGG